jgi:hypothetical protein
MRAARAGAQAAAPAPTPADTREGGRATAGERANPQPPPPLSHLDDLPPILEVGPQPGVVGGPRQAAHEYLGGARG